MDDNHRSVAERGHSRHLRVVLVVALLVTAVKGCAVALVTPAFQTPDEYGHYDYVLYLSRIDLLAFVRGDVAAPRSYNDITTEELWAVTRATGTETHLRGPGLKRPLPTLCEQVRAGCHYESADTHDRLREKTVVPAQFNYPPLYYGLLATVVKGVRLATPNPVIAYYTARSVSLVLLLLTVYLTYATSQVVFAARPGVTAVTLATMFVALQPQLTMLGTSVQADMLTVTLVAAVSAVAVRYRARSRFVAAAVLGVLVGGLFLTKLHAAFVVLFAVLSAIVLAHRLELRSTMRRLAVVTSLALSLGGWWYLRTWLLYGSATGMVAGEFRTPVYGGRIENLMTWLSMWRLTYESFWGMWGWLEVPLPGWSYWLMTLATVGSVAYGMRPGAVRATVAQSSWPTVAYVSVLAIGYVAVMVAVAVVVGPIHNNQGRHWLPIIVVGALALGHCGAAAASSMEERGAWFAVFVWMALLSGANTVLAMKTWSFYYAR